MPSKNLWGRSVRPLHAAFAALLLACLPLSLARAADNPPEFGGQCTEGLAEGKHVTTNCAITWKDKDGKTYCFSSEASKKSFLENPSANLQKAHDFFAASSIESTEKAMQNFTGSDAAQVATDQSDAKVKANNGVYPLEDPLTGAQLKLAFDGVDFTRTIDGYGFFPDVKFHDATDAQKKYLVDFWVIPVNGVLQVQETRIY